MRKLLTTRQSYFYPEQAAIQTVLSGKSIACSSPAAAAFENQADPSGRAVAGVHRAAE